ncbi:hypothetical protein ES702_07582 [subsurface metagenome]
MFLEGCAYCDEDEGRLTLVELHGVLFQLCDLCLHWLLKLSKADHYFSPASCKFG